MSRICLVTPGHLSTDPRLVKEADALTEAGHHVTTVTGRFIAWAAEADREFESRAWRRIDVPFGPEAGAGTWLRQGLTRVAREALRTFGSSAALETAEHPATADLTAAAAHIEAELFIGHNLAGLIAAGRAAQRRGARLGFDAEDDHVGELPSGARFDAPRARRLALHRRFVARCAHLTAAAPLMAEALAARYDRRFTTVLNVFPVTAGSVWREAPVGEPVLGWVSQTIGPGRGLEEVIALVAAMSVPARLELVGRCQPGYCEHLRALAAGKGLAPERLRIAPPVAPRAIAAAYRGFTLGLSTESPETENRDVCLGNKIFHSLAAGTPVLLSRTRAQDALAAELGPAALSVDIRSPTAAPQLDAWLRDAAGRERARRTAERLARERYSWDVEKHTFLASVERALAEPGA